MFTVEIGISPGIQSKRTATKFWMSCLAKIICCMESVWIVGGRDRRTSGRVVVNIAWMRFLLQISGWV